VAPAGFVPSATTLVGVWLFFVGQSLVVVEMVVNEAARRRSDGSSGVRRSGSGGVHQTGAAAEKTGPQGAAAAAAAMVAPDVGLPSIARRALGPWGETAVASLLVVLTMTTLVSQISKAGAVAAPAISFAAVGGSVGLGGYRAACACVALSLGGLVFGGGAAVATRANAWVTGVFAVSGAALFAVGAPHADWARLATPCHWPAAAHAIPTFLQLLVYGESCPRFARCCSTSCPRSAKPWWRGRCCRCSSRWRGLRSASASRPRRDLPRRRAQQP